MAICPDRRASFQQTSRGRSSEPDPPCHDPVTGQKVGRLRDCAAVPMRRAIGHARRNSSVGVFQSAAMGRLLCPVAAGRHAAPASGVAMRRVKEKQRARRPFTFPDHGKVCRASKLRHFLSERGEHADGGAPPPACPKLERRQMGVARAAAVRTRHDGCKRLVLGEKPVEWRQLAKGC